jgi:hypothetical protein
MLGATLPGFLPAFRAEITQQAGSCRKARALSAPGRVEEVLGARHFTGLRIITTAGIAGAKLNLKIS